MRQGAREIASAMTIDPSGKVTFAHKGSTYDIVPYQSG